MKKAWIETRYERGMGRVPSINVKIGLFGNHPQFAPGLSAELLNCDEATYETAMQYAFDMAQSQFWEDAQELAEHHLGRGPGYKRDVKVYSVGRSSGHLVVEGLDDVEDWNAILVSAWGRFVGAIESDIANRCAAEQVKENILANRWNEPGAEAYNFMDRKDGTTICMSEMKAQAAAAGFGPVIRA